eukprot:3320463-Prymnesium_polylepis.1
MERAIIVAPPPAAAATSTLVGDDAVDVLVRASPQFTARFAVGGTCRLEHVWPIVSQVADQVLAQAFARLQLCKCDL